MSVSWRHLAFLAVAISLVLVIIPSGAAHGSDSGSFSSHGGSGQSGAAAVAGESGGSSPSTGGGATIQARAGQETAGSSPAAGAGPQGGAMGSGESTSIAVKASGGDATYARAGQESRCLSSVSVSGLQAGYRGCTWSAESWASQGQGFQGSTHAGAGYGEIPPAGSGEALPPGQHRGPSSHAKPCGTGTQAGRFPCGPAQTSEPLAGAPGAADQEPKAPSYSKGRKDGEDDEPEPGEPLAAGHAIPPIFLPFLGYRRISGKNVLEHDGRNRVYLTIVDHPGIDILAISDMVEINRNTLRYHLFTLLRAGKVTAFSRPGVVRYYQNQGMYPPFVQCLLHHLWTDTPREIIALLLYAPGMTRTQVAEALSLSGPSITRHMQNLVEDGIVETLVLGRSHHYSLTHAALETLASYGRMAPMFRDSCGKRPAALSSAA